MVAGRWLLVCGLLVTGCVGDDVSSPSGTTAPSGDGAPPPETSVSSPSVADTTDEGPRGWTVDEVTAARAAALSSLEGVRATRHPDVVFAAPDGRVWVSKASGAFESYDPDTGTYRALHAGELGGVLHAQEIAGPPGWRDGRGLAWREEDPFVPLVSEIPGAEVRVVETLREAQPSWEIVWSDGSTEERMVVDRATGLVVEHQRPGTGGWALTDVRPVEELPDEFPGEIPDGVEVDRPFSVPLIAMSLDEAGRRFTPGLVVPDDLLRQPSTVFLTREGDDSAGFDPRGEEATMYLADGFDVTRIVVSKFLTHDGITIDDGDLECYDIDGDERCDFRDRVAGTVRSGALAGREFTEDGGAITVYDAGRTVTIFGVDPARTRRIADSLVPV